MPEQIQAPVPSDVALENSADGAEAYAYFLFQAWWYLINTHDIDWWDANIPQASWSEPLRSSAIRQIDKGISNRTAPITPTTLDRKVNPENQNEFGITLQASVSEIYAISRDGKTTVAHPAGTYELTARLLYNGNNWDTVAVVLVEAEGEK
ncbi:DUF6318 family protein [Buchananella felis]|uniref:DUF6318 family protein n=1 Tax=Buchananella felis TaxID=3231492 RepID=UPI003527DCA7